MNINIKQIGTQIRKFRKIAELTQEELAEHINLSVQYIGYLENGKKGASLDTIIDIANALGITVDPLLLGNLHCEITVHIYEFTELIICCGDEDRDYILDAAIEAAKALSCKINSDP